MQRRWQVPPVDSGAVLKIGDTIVMDRKAPCPNAHQPYWGAALFVVELCAWKVQVRMDFNHKQTLKWKRV